jgi:hypothetical protein
MSLSVSDILLNADTFRRAYPSWPHPEPEERAMYRYAGTDRNGTARGGGTADAAALAEQCFKRGWKWLRITDGDGHEAGGIKLSDDRPRRRIWWAEAVSGTGETKEG